MNSRVQFPVVSGAVLALIALGTFIALTTTLSADFESSARACITLSGAEQKECMKSAATLLAGYTLRTQSEYIDRTLSNPEFGGICHMFAHTLGGVLYEKSDSLNEALGSCTDACSSGCYHGAAESYLVERIQSGDSASEEALLSELHGIYQCGPDASPECVTRTAHAMHGAGHALMFVLNNDLPKSLALCDSVENARACYSGVFMSNYLSLEDSTHPSLYIRTDDPLFPCTELSERYRESCYENQTTFFFDEEVEPNVALCEQVPSAYRDLCLRHVANKKIQKITDSVLLAEVCAVIPNTYPRHRCIENIVDRLIERKSDSATDVTAFCTSLTGAEKDTCVARNGLY